MPRKKPAEELETVLQVPENVNQIKLKSVRFSEIPFRKLKMINIQIASRFTVIAGRNGVGKSTLLGLIANASGITRGKQYTSYFGRLPQGNLHEIIHLSVDRDFIEEENLKPNIFLTYEANGVAFTKKCNVTAREEDGLRIVPRNDSNKPVSAGGVKIPAAGKVPLPTIYLGMIRMLPVGEVELGSLENSTALTMSKADALYIDEFTKRIIATGSVDTDPVITHQWIKGTRKGSMHPPYLGYDSKAVSLGQDSLSSIATALASFQKLQTIMGEKYPGGLLVIDEIDTGFHPRAQRQLFQELQTEARRLRLQIVATTHSLCMLEEVHRSILKVPQIQDRQDAIVYLQGGNPVQLLDVSEYKTIHNDMFLAIHIAPPPKKPIKIYVEDDEAALILSAILTKSQLKKIETQTNQKIEILSCHLGCTNLMALHKADKYFKTVVVVLDGDTSTAKVAHIKNIIRLPTDPLVRVKQAPEPIIESMCKSLVNDVGTYPITRSLLQKAGYSTDHVQELILNRQGSETAPIASVATNREHAKDWFNRRLPSVKSLKLIEGWVADNALGVGAFMTGFTAAVRVAEAEIDAQEFLAKPLLN